LVLSLRILNKLLPQRPWAGAAPIGVRSPQLRSVGWRARLSASRDLEVDFTMARHQIAPPARIVSPADLCFSLSSSLDRSSVASDANTRMLQTSASTSLSSHSKPETEITQQLQ